MNSGKKHNVKKILSILLMIVFLCVFLFSLYKVAVILKEYRSIDMLYDETSETYITEAEDETDRVTPEVELEALREVNKDVIGWIYIPDTDVSFPILKGKSNKQYLYQSYKKEYSTAGSIFIDYRCRANFKDKSTVIYGHNMHNGSMFGSLKKYKKESYRDKHPYIYIMKKDGAWNKYEVAAYYQASVEGPTYNLPMREADEQYADESKAVEGESGNEAFDELLQTINRDNVYLSDDGSKATAKGESGDTEDADTVSNDFELSEDDKIIILSTCTQDSRNDVRVAIAARLTETIEYND